MNEHTNNLCCQKCTKDITEDQTAICCDFCNLWFHLNCSSLNKVTFQFFVDNPASTWFCQCCHREALPFQSLSENQFKNVLVTQTKENADLHERLTTPTCGMNRKCSVCNRMVRDVKKSIPCSDCNSLIHRRCSRLQSWQLVNTVWIYNEWCCSHCWNHKFPFSDLNDNQLIELAFNSNFSCICQVTVTESSDYRLLDKLDLCKFNLKEQDNNFDNDIDNHAKFHTNFDYYSTHSFHKLIANLDTQNQPILSVFHSNIQSLLGNFENLEILLQNVDFSFDVIALSETWHTHSNKDKFKDLSLPGYHFYKGKTGNRKSGGCGFFVSANIKFNVREDLNKDFIDNNCEFETFWIEIEKTVVGVIYNHPRRNSTDFLIHLDSVLKKLSKENKDVIISGDFNLDLLRTDKVKMVENFVNLMFTSFYQPLILQPTRYTDRHRPSLVDNIFINSLDLNIVSGNLTAKISDHMPNFVLIDKKINRNPISKSIKRDFRNFNESNFASDISDTNLVLDNSTNLETKYEYFQNSILNVINKHAPLKPLSRK